jgi:NAD(P)-dependent dehydrogenase (short-subunit alcohol dehydrogenase family)
VDRLVGKVCVVNGAASVIGQAVAARFASEGGVVVGVDQVEHAVGQLTVQADLADEAQVEAMYEQIVREYGRLDKRLVHWPMGRFGTLEEAAATIAFLASEDSGFITAAALPLDGGITKAFTVPE